MRNLDEALHLAAAHRRDPRPADHLLRQTARDIQELDEDQWRLVAIQRLIFRHVAQRRLEIRRHLALADLVVISADDVAGLKNAIGEAARSGLGWLIAAERTAIIVPRPVVRLAEGRSDVCTTTPAAGRSSGPTGMVCTSCEGSH